MKLNKLNDVIVISNLIYPLRTPLFNELTARKKARFFFMFLRETLGNRKWTIDRKLLKFKYIILPSLEIPLSHNDYFPYLINTSIYSELLSRKFDTIISIGWAYPANLIALLVCLFYKKTFILWSESTASEKTFRRWLAYPWIWLFVKCSKKYIVPGKRAAEHLMSYGAPKDKITIAHNAIDSASFRSLATVARKKKIIRKKLNLNSRDFVFLFVGRMEKVKNLPLLLYAFQAAQKYSKNIHLILVGYGPVEFDLKEIVKREQIAHVHFFEGTKSRDELIQYYAAGNALVLPSSSQAWGYVLNEGLACSLPVVVSDAVGSVGDLVINKRNGLTFPSGNEFKLTQALVKLAKNSTLYSRLKKQSLESIKKFTYQEMSIQVEKAVCN